MNIFTMLRDQLFSVLIKAYDFLESQELPETLITFSKAKHSKGLIFPSEMYDMPFCDG